MAKFYSRFLYTTNEKSAFSSQTAEKISTGKTNTFAVLERLAFCLDDSVRRVYLRVKVAPLLHKGAHREPEAVGQGEVSKGPFNRFCLVVVTV